ncbi:MAG TPA: type IV pilin [Desulfobacteria bacterium]|nr:type IV pilin [Desulfobacteria bacterium]
MKSDCEKEGREGVSPVIGVIMMIAIVVIIAAVVAAFAYGIIGGVYKSEPSFYIKIEQTANKDCLGIMAFNASDFQPLPNVIVAVVEHGVERVISGPQMTNKTGFCIIEIPEGYSECFDIVAVHENETRTTTVDKRARLVKIGDKLGPLGIQLLSIGFGALLGWIGRLSFERLKSKEKS